MAQNVSKMEVVPCAMGLGSVAVMDDMFEWGARMGCEIKERAKYLGNAMSWGGKCKYNLDERARAMKGGYYAFMKYWGRTGVRLTARALIFRIVVF